MSESVSDFENAARANLGSTQVQEAAQCVFELKVKISASANRLRLQQNETIDYWHRLRRPRHTHLFCRSRPQCHQSSSPTSIPSGRSILDLAKVPTLGFAPFCSTASPIQASISPVFEKLPGNEKALVPQGEQGLFLMFLMVEPRRLELLTS